jgi:outer membrane protein
MKKIGLIGLFALLLISCTPSKIAYVNVEELLKEYKGTKETEAILKLKSDSLKAELDSLVSGWQSKAMTYQQNSSKMSPKKRADKEQTLMQEQQLINQRQQVIQQQVQTEGQDSLKAISKEIKDFVESYAKENGYNFIFGTNSDNGTIMYGEDKADITDDVLLKLNKNFKPKK